MYARRSIITRASALTLTHVGSLPFRREISSSDALTTWRVVKGIKIRQRTQIRNTNVCWIFGTANLNRETESGKQVQNIQNI